MSDELSVFKARQWIEENAPEFKDADPIDAMIALLDFYLYGPPKAPLSALEQMQAEAATGKMIEPNEFMVRVLDEMMEDMQPSLDEILERLEEKTEGIWNPIRKGPISPSERFKKR